MTPTPASAIIMPPASISRWRKNSVVPGGKIVGLARFREGEAIVPSLPQV
jgi:hypothetical protein